MIKMGTVLLMLTTFGLVGIFTSLIHQYDLHMECALIPLCAVIVMPLYNLSHIPWEELITKTWCGVLFGFLSVFPDQFNKPKIVPLNVPQFIINANILSAVVLLVVFLFSLINTFRDIRRMNFERFSNRDNMQCCLLLALFVGLILSYGVGTLASSSLLGTLSTIILIDGLLISIVFGLFTEEHLRSFMFCLIGILVNFGLQSIQTCRIWILDTNLDFMTSGIYPAVILLTCVKEREDVDEVSHTPPIKQTRKNDIYNCLIHISFVSAFITTNMVLTKSYLDSETESVACISVFIVCYVITMCRIPLSLRVACTCLVMLLYMLIGSQFHMVRNGSIADCILGLLLVELVEHKPYKTVLM